MAYLFENGPLTLKLGVGVRKVVLNVPFTAGQSRIIVIEGDYDVGKYFTQSQVNEWKDLKDSLEKGILVAFAEGTIPK